MDKRESLWWYSSELFQYYYQKDFNNNTVLFIKFFILRITLSVSFYLARQMEVLFYCSVFLICLLFLLISAPEPPFEALEVSTTPLSIGSPAQPPPSTAERKQDKPAEEPDKTKVQLFYYYEAAMQHCHGSFTIFLSKWLKYLTKNLFSNMKLLLEHREGNIKDFYPGKNKLLYKQFLMTSLQYTGQFFQVAIHFDLSHPQQKIINTSFCALLGSLLTIKTEPFF